MELQSPSVPACNLVKLIKQLIKEAAYDGVQMLFTNSNESARNLECIPEIATELFHEVCLEHLKEQNFFEQPELYGCVEELLKIVAAHGPIDVLLIELLEIIEEHKSECVFTSSLRAMQVLLLRQGKRKPQALEWCLQSINYRLQELPLPKYLSEGYDSEQARLLEQDALVQSVLTHYIMVGFFFKPILQDTIENEKRLETQIFRDCGTNRRNVLCCFLMQLLGKPLALLDMNYAEDGLTNSYVQQRVTHITNGITQLIVDPFYLLTLVEQRARWKRRLDASKGVYERSCKNIFLIEEKMPLYALGIYYHALLVGGLCPDNAPKIYTSLFLFESGLYLAAALIKCDEPALHNCAIRLIEQLLINMQFNRIPSTSLELDVHKTISQSLCHIVVFATQVGLRQLSVHVLKKYIDQFDDEGAYILLMNLLNDVEHSGLFGYLGSIYKDRVSQAMEDDNAVLPDVFTGQKFRAFILKSICCLPQNAESDLLRNSDKLFCAANSLRFFIVRDSKNRTGIWDFIDIIERDFLKPLRCGLDLSIAHFKAEYQRVEKGLDERIDSEAKKRLKLLDIKVANSTEHKNHVKLDVSRDEKLKILSQSLLTMDSLMSCYARTNECFECALKKYRKKFKLNSLSNINNKSIDF